ncbi:MAG: hypothetical protein R3E53_08730 [Myxococcota bacterium]
MRFATSLLGALQEGGAVGRAARRVPCTLTDRGACVAFLSDVLRELMAGDRTPPVAITTPSPAASALLRGARRAELPRLRRIRDSEFPFKAGIEVTG